ncbi:ABC transporter permease [Planococcus sp. N028]|uniref:ABC transporter permease n=1 Tax=Planococcus shixiaomingii TaxID=3058393 RepID=A0ABT8MYD3_9BACL|nr:ABC transporter permease [Planococcus sp. N028]MDN7240595.1 ABC transporter permease [Planococcus sp. N028]
MEIKNNLFMYFTAASFVALLCAVLFAPLLAVHEPLAVQMNSVLQPPSSAHLLGTDELGRDVFSRLLYGGRVSMAVGAAAMLVSVAAGILYGAVSALAGGVTDRIMMRLIDALLSIPSLLLMIGLQLVFSSSLLAVILVISLTSWMPIARLIRTELIAMKNDVFIQASTVVGASRFHLLHRHMLPQCIPTIIVLAISGISHAVLAEATLSFLGIGIPPQEPSWGNMLMGAQSYLLGGAWWLAVFPAGCITYTILAINFLGERLQDRLTAPQFRKENKNEWISS